MNDWIRNGQGTGRTVGEIIGDLTRTWGDRAPSAIVFFADAAHDGAALSAAFRTRYPGVPNVGCTTAGELTQRSNRRGTVVALAIGSGKVRRAAAALSGFDGGVRSSVGNAVSALSRELDVDLKRADGRRYVGITLIEGLGANEEECNEALGDAAPLVSFVGGSAGDGDAFVRTRVFANGAESENGTALLLLDCAVPFFVGKTCSFEPTGQSFTVTRADIPNRTVYELDGKPVAQVYAKALGITPKELDATALRGSPVGLMVDGAAWIRSPRRMLADGGMQFFCRIEQGIEVGLMRGTDLIEDAHAFVARATRELGAPIAGGLVFNCIQRRYEIDARNLEVGFLSCFSGMEMAGFHTYGESWLAHMNQTLTALWFA